MLDILLFGLISGAVVALGSLGLSLIFSQFRFLNFAYGELLTLGAYLYLTFGGLRLGWVAVVASAIAVGAAGLALHVLVFKPLVSRGPIIMTVASMGVGFALQNVFASVWGTQVTEVSIPTIPWSVGAFGRLQVTTVVAVVVLASAVAGLLFGTRTGRQLRAAADNRTLAAVTGVDLRVVGLLTWGVGAALAGVAGVLLAADGQLTPSMGYLTLFPIIAAVLITGGRNPFGAALGGFAIGLASELAARYVGSAYKPAMAIAVLAVALYLSATLTRKVRV